VKRVDSLDRLQYDRPLVLAIGTFDGVHRGHRYMLAQAHERARAHGLAFGVITFDPAPALVLRPGLADYQITGRATKERLLAALEPDFLAVLPFTRAFAALTPEEFVDQLETGLKVAEMWMGDDFRFGHGREGGIPYLIERGRRSGFDVHVVARQGVEAGAPGVSSSAVRDAIRAGDMGIVTLLLGRPFELSGEVVHGQRRGRTLGYPTANVAVGREQIVPASGVYAAVAELSSGADAPSERHAAAVSVGTNPHFNGIETTVEAYLLDFDRDIYGRDLRVSFVERLRAQERYDGLAPLLAQMAADVEDTRRIIGPLLSNQPSVVSHQLLADG